MVGIASVSDADDVGRPCSLGTVRSRRLGVERGRCEDLFGGQGLIIVSTEARMRLENLRRTEEKTDLLDEILKGGLDTEVGLGRAFCKENREPSGQR